MNSVIHVPQLRQDVASTDPHPQLPPGDPSDTETDIAVLREVPHQFAITDDNSANWLVRRVVAAREYAERVKAWCDQEVRRANREQQTLLFLYGHQMEAWVAGEIAKFNGRRKSVALPGGTVGFRRSTQKTVIDDEKAVLEWAKANCPQAVVVVEKVAKLILDTYIHETGHVPENGIHVEPATDKFYIR